MASPRIALIHTLKVSMDPVHAAFSVDWPQAKLVNISDDSLAGDRSRHEYLTGDIAERIVGLGRYAVSTGADAILYTCSAFGPAIDRAAEELTVPVLKPNEAMFQEALGHGNNIGMLVTFKPSLASLTQEFEDECAHLNRKANLRSLLITEAMDALRNGDAPTHNRLVADMALRLGACDAIMLAQFSTARAAASVRAVTKIPVLTAPNAAVLKLKRLFGAA